jgi:hypothetical protein
VRDQFSLIESEFEELVELVELVEFWEFVEFVEYLELLEFVELGLNGGYRLMLRTVQRT